MAKATIKFINGETLTVREGQLLFPLSKSTSNGEEHMTKLDPRTLSAHHNLGLVPSVLDVLLAGIYFSATDELGKVYNSSAVVSVENSD